MPTLKASVPPESTPATESQATEVALACAVLNAAIAFSLVTLPPARVTSVLVQSLAEASRRHPELVGFSVTREGRATVSSIARAASTLPRGLAHWLQVFFAGCERAAPGRFYPVALDDILGGLGSMVRHAGWHAALLAVRSEA